MQPNDPILLGPDTLVEFEDDAQPFPVDAADEPAVTALALSADGRRALSGRADGTLRWCDLETGRASVLQGHSGRVTAVALTPDGRHGLSSSADGTTRRWDLEAGTSTVLRGLGE